MDIAWGICDSDLGRHNNIVAVPAKVLDRAAHYLLRLTCRVALGAVEEVDARVVRGLQAGKRVVVADVAAVCEPRTERDGGDLEAALTGEAVLHFREVCGGFGFRHGGMRFGDGGERGIGQLLLESRG
jgi:hypothetical protein